MAKKEKIGKSVSSAENDLREAEVDQAVEWALFWLFSEASRGPESGLGVETELLDSFPFVFSPVGTGILYLELVVASGLISK